MKKAAVLLLLLASGLAGAQETDRKFSVQVNPFMLVGDIFMGASDQETYSYYLCFELQYAIDGYWNVTLRPYFSAASGIYNPDFMRIALIDSNPEGTYLAFGLMPGVLFRPAGRGLRGLYLGLYPNFGWERGTGDPDAAGNFLVLGIGVEAGYEWVFRNGFSITLGSGLERNWGIALEKDTGAYRGPGDALYNIRLVFFLGYSF